MAQPTLTPTLTQADGGEVYLAGDDCILAWVLDKKSRLEVDTCTYTKATGVINKDDDSEFKHGADYGYEGFSVSVRDGNNDSWDTQSYEITDSDVDSITIALGEGTPATDTVDIRIFDPRPGRATWVHYRSNKILGLDLLDADDSDAFLLRLPYFSGQKKSIDGFSSNTYKDQDDNTGVFIRQFTLPEGLATGNYKVRVGDYPSGVDSDANEGKIRGTTDAFAITAARILTYTAPITSDTWNMGEAEDITWGSLDGWEATEYVDVFYRKEPPSVENYPDYPWVQMNAGLGITGPATTILNTAASFTWDIPPNLEAGEYEIGILRVGEDPADMSKYFISDGFTVAARTLTFTAPVDDDDDWLASGSETISWTCVGFELDHPDFEQEVALSYRKSSDDEGDGKERITELDANISTGGAGTFAWTLPSDIEEGVYVIIAIDTYDVLVGTSGQFNIVEKSISSKNPFHGDYWHIGDIVTIKWEFTGYAGSDTIAIAWTVNSEDDYVGHDITASVALSVGEQAWDTAGRAEESYKLRFSRGADLYYSDVFSLADGVAAFNSIERKTRVILVADEKVFYENDSNVITRVVQGPFVLGVDGCTYTTGSGVINKADAGEFTGGAGDGYAGQYVSVTDGDDDSWTQSWHLILGSSVNNIEIALGLGTDTVHVNIASLPTVAPETPSVAIVPAYQKMFIGDGTQDGLYMVDMANVRILGAYGGGEAEFIRGQVVTDGGVTAIFDHGDATTIYLYRTTAHKVADGDALTDGTSTFTVTRDEIGPPHWLPWVANDGKGSLPESATIGTMYRGRIVLAGDRKNPHIWYMSRAGDPFDWLYAAEDAASPIAGGDGDVGEVGDIITALIDFHDDYMILGCNQSLWLMRGDPAAGGSLDHLTSADGIFGANSWCYDANNILYYVGLGGVYALISGELPKPITTTRIPTFMSGISREQHVINMVYDVRRHGIVITITKVDITTPEDYGECTAWWLDLRTGGFFPETYPQNAGVFSSIYFGAEEAAFEHLLLGCHDGQIRRFDDDSKDDEGPDSTSVAIDAHVLYPPQRLGGPGREGRLNKIIVTPGGGNSDSDSLTYDIFVGDTAQKVLNDSNNNATPHTTSTITGVTREIKRPRAKGSFGAVKVKGANTADSSFAVESIIAETQDGGRVK